MLQTIKTAGKFTVLLAGVGLGSAVQATTVFADSFEEPRSIEAKIQLNQPVVTTQLYAAPLNNSEQKQAVGSTDNVGKLPLTSAVSSSPLTVLSTEGGTSGGSPMSGQLHAVLPKGMAIDKLNISLLSDIAWRMVDNVQSRMSDADLNKLLDDTALILIKKDFTNDGKVDYQDILAFDASNPQHISGLRFDYNLFTKNISGDTIINSYLNGDAKLTFRLETAFAGILNFHTSDDEANDVQIKVSVFGEGKINSSDSKFALDSAIPLTTKANYYAKGTDTITLTATPTAKTKIHSWNGCMQVSDDLTTCTVNKSKNQEVVANFAQKTVKVAGNLVIFDDYAMQIDGDIYTMLIDPTDTRQVGLVNEVATGTYIVGSYQDGYLRKVTAVEAVSGLEYRFTTVNAGLQEIIEQGTGILSRQLTQADLPATAGQTSGGTMNGRKLYLKRSATNNSKFEVGYYQKRNAVHDAINRCFEFDTDGFSEGKAVLRGKTGEDACKLGDLGFTPVLTLDIDMDLAFDFSLWKLHSAKVYPKINVTTELGFETNSSTKFDGEAELFKQKFKPITFFIGYVPVVITPQLTITLTAEGEVTSQFTMNVGVTQTVGAGFLYTGAKSGQSAKLELLGTMDHNLDFEPPTLELNAEAKLGLDNKIGLLLYGAVGPAVTMTPYVKANGHYVTSLGEIPITTTCEKPYFQASFGMDLSIGLDSGMDTSKFDWLDDFLNKKKTFPIKEWPFYELRPRQCQRPIIAVSGNALIGTHKISENTATKTYIIKNIGGKPLTWGVDYSDSNVAVMQPHRSVSVNMSGAKRTLQPSESTQVTVTVDLSQLPVGRFRQPLRFVNNSSDTYDVLSFSNHPQPPQSLAITDSMATAVKDISIDVVPGLLPEASNVLVTQGEGKSVQLTWDAPLPPATLAEYIDGYQVWVKNLSLNNADYQLAHTVPVPMGGVLSAGSQSVVINTPDGGASYEFVVQTKGYLSSSNGRRVTTTASLPTVNLSILQNQPRKLAMQKRSAQPQVIKVTAGKPVTLIFDANQKLHSPEITISGNSTAYPLQSNSTDGKSVTSWKHTTTFTDTGTKTITLSTGLVSLEALLHWIYNDLYEQTFTIEVVSDTTVTPRPTKLNDTGITKCGTADGTSNTADCSTAVANAIDSQVPLGQDGHYGTGINGSKGMSFTKVSGYEGKCVQDNHTGLMWEVKQGGDGTVGNEGLHDADDTYNWYSDTNNRGAAGYKNNSGATCHGYDNNSESTFCNTQAYVARVNIAGWCGYSDWRLPTLRDLHSIVDYALVNPVIDTAYFPQTRNSFYWSSSPDSNNSYSAWRIHFGSGGGVSYGKANSYSVRLVRGGL